MRRNIRRAFAFDGRIRIITAQFDVTPERDCGHAVVGGPVLSPKQARTEARRESLNADFEELRDDEVPEFVENNRRAEDEYKSENSNYAALKQTHLSNSYWSHYCQKRPRGSSLITGCQK